MKRLVIIQTAAPDYRTAFFNEIQEHLKEDFELYSGLHYFEKSIRTDRSIKDIQLCSNHFFVGRRFLFQTGIWHLLFFNGIVVLEMNPRILSNWMFLIIRKIFGKKTVLWGHAWPRKGKESFSDLVRQRMRLLASSIITYTDKQKEELQQKMPKMNIIAAPNALYSAKTMSAGGAYITPKHVLYVGRLTSAKKPKFMIEGFQKALMTLPSDINLIIVGDGEEKHDLVDYIAENKLEKRVFLKGHISDIDSLRDLYANSICSISPGYIGLSVTQSFGFGVPMLVSRTENHSPEIEAVQEGVNAIFFETDNAESFRDNLLKFIDNKKYWMEKRLEIQHNCKINYSIEAMGQVFINLVKTHA